MELFSELFSDWVGILSIIVIVFMLGMGGFFTWLFLAKSADPNE